MMSEDKHKTKDELIHEIAQLRQELAKLTSHNIGQHNASHLKSLEILRQASLSLTASLDIDVILRLITEYALKLVNAMTAHIFTYDGQDLHFGGATWEGKRQDEPFAPPRRDGFTYYVAHQAQPVLVHDMSKHPVYEGTGWTGSIIGLPLKVDQQVRGVMTISLPQPNAFADEELRILELLADQAAIAIQNAQYVYQIEQEIQERTTIQNALLQSEVRYRSLFENSPISLREEDWSAVKQEIEILESAGISNLPEYLTEHPAMLKEWAKLVQLLDMNQSTLIIYGATTSDQLNDGHLSYGLNEEASKFFKESLIQLRQGNKYYQTEVLQYTLRGDPIYLLLGLAVAPEDTDYWTRVLVSAVDITQRKEAEARALALEKEQTRADTLYRLIQAITHDLRTPLTSINTSTYLLKSTKDEARRQHHLNIIEGQTIHLSNLIDSILDVARLDTLQSLDFTMINFSMLLDHLDERFQELAQDKNINLSFTTEDDNIMLNANERELSNALGEIIKNSIQFTSAQGFISVTTYRTKYSVETIIEDNGAGMSQEILAQAFDPFYRADEARSSKTGGTGLGLALAKKIIELHNGSIDVQSTVDQGTVCHISLPLNASS